MAYSARDLWGTVLFSALLVGLPVTANAARDYGTSRVQIQILDKDSGNAVEGAAVCLGTSARVDQFGASRTNRDGLALFEELLPDTVYATVSRTGFQGRRHLLESIVDNRVFVLKIVPGGGGVQCNAPADPGNARDGSGLLIERLVVRGDTGGDAGLVRVSLTVTGSANQVRISEASDFSGARWQQMELPLKYKLSDGRGLKNLYVQVRRFAQVEGGQVEVVSPVRRAQYRY